MPKGYIVARVTVTDPVQYANYTRLVAAAIERYGARPLARGGRFEALEGDARPRNVIMEFDSYEDARAYYFSPEYQRAKREREGAANAELIVLEGAD